MNPCCAIIASDVGWVVCGDDAVGYAYVPFRIRVCESHMKRAGEEGCRTTEYDNGGQRTEEELREFRERERGRMTWREICRHLASVVR